MLTNFIAKFTLREEGQGVVCNVEVHPWRVFVDGTSNAMGVGVGIVVILPEGVKLEHLLRLGFKASNNEAEYKALLIRLRAAHSLEVANLKVYSDSWLVVSQVEGSFEAKDSWMIKYLKLVNQIVSKFLKEKIIQITRGQNRHANSLATLASSLANEIPRLIKVEVVQDPNIDPKVEFLSILPTKSS